MNAFEVYQTYVALKRHFSSKSYDYFRYHGKTKATLKSFERRKDQIFFKKLAKNRDPLMMLVYNLAENDQWIGEICINEFAIELYRRHKKFNQSLSYQFKLELNKFDSCQEMVSAEENTHPLVLRKYIQGTISLETLVLVVDIMRPISYWKSKFPDDLIVEQMVHRVTKFKGFMKYDREKMKDILKGELLGS